MSSRLTKPVSKLTRSISSTSSINRPSHLLNNASKTSASAAGRKRPSNVTAAEESTADVRVSLSTPKSPLIANTRPQYSTAPHRPTPSPARKIPLMQGFRTSAPKPAQLDTIPIDHAILPDLFASHHASPDPYAYIRVPLLPDNRAPPAFARLPEAVDAPLPAPEILVVAANPDLVLPAALTEVEGMGVDGVELGFVRDIGRDVEAEGHGMVRDIWKGLVEDVFGEKKSIA
ncbi:hypothetical protein B0T25DRAFT_85264 [Lasiosphaeria hispida]|uniref:Uncharacterized protein n=1 Tax=Lasiosphaeria hispida TaxID=260671 RepID=A0AAJ0HPY6_9PEZI|nr:hypothetical protein B0T25DRAFT_85264 [Lasiosphaeria hispida]